MGRLRHHAAGSTARMVWISSSLGCLLLDPMVSALLLLGQRLAAFVSRMSGIVAQLRRRMPETGDINSPVAAIVFSGCLHGR